MILTQTQHDMDMAILKKLGHNTVWRQPLINIFLGIVCLFICIFYVYFKISKINIIILQNISKIKEIFLNIFFFSLHNEDTHVGVSLVCQMRTHV